MSRILLALALASAGLAGCATTGKPSPFPSQPMCMPCSNPCFPGADCAGAVKPAAAAPAPAPVAAPAPAAAATFSPGAGTYTGQQLVTLSSATPGAVIHYTTDGTAPSAASPVYTGPIPVNGNTTIRAVVLAPGLPESAQSAAGYDVRPPPPPPPAAAPAPAPSRVVVTASKLELKEKVFFDTGKTSIKAVSNPLLDEVAQVLKGHPEVKKLVVEGHTDDRGGAAKNQKLSEGRARAVKDALVKRGVEAGRLEAKGLGETRPIADNKSEKGREENRRVELMIAP